ncbi:MAG: hypothetical protein ACR2JF_03685 [Iamia sp.]
MDGTEPGPAGRSGQGTDARSAPAPVRTRRPTIDGSVCSASWDPCGVRHPSSATRRPKAGRGWSRARLHDRLAETYEDRDLDEIQDILNGLGNLSLDFARGRVVPIRDTDGVVLNPPG